jgi:hypothetical protein
MDQYTLDTGKTGFDMVEVDRYGRMEACTKDIGQKIHPMDSVGLYMLMEICKRGIVTLMIFLFFNDFTGLGIKDIGRMTKLTAMERMRDFKARNIKAIGTAINSMDME